MFRSFLTKKPSLSGAPAVRRLKTYPAQSGFVYQYYYAGRRPCGSGRERGVEFVFSVSADRKTFHDVSVIESDAVMAEWQSARGRELSSTERYAIAKIALFQAFDERPSPAKLMEAVRIRHSDVDAIAATLGFL